MLGLRFRFLSAGFTVVLTALLNGSCSSLQKTSDSIAIHWWHNYSFFEVPFADENKFQELLPDQSPVTTTQRGFIYRVPGKKVNRISTLGYRQLKDIPFWYVDPDIKSRSASTDPAVWFSGYKNNEIVAKILGYFEKERPDLCKRYVIGRSVRNQPIEALRITLHPTKNEGDQPALLFNGAHHGNELLSIDYVLDMAANLLDLPAGPPNKQFQGLHEAERRQLLSAAEVWIVPVVNPDGVDDYWNRSIYFGRKNTNSVDLNRNYPFQWATGRSLASGRTSEAHDFHGPYAGSEPETKAMMQLAKTHRFAIVFSYHTFATRLLFPYTIDDTMNPWPDRAYYYAMRWAAKGESFRSERRYEAARKLYSVDGTDQDWLFHSFGSLAYIVEGSMSSPYYSDGLLSIAGMRPVWKAALTDFLYGPRLEVRVYDVARRPVATAQVKILNEVLFEGESWTVEPKTGRFDILPGPLESFEIEISAKGYQTVRKKISCKNICKEKFYLTSI